VTRPEGGKRVSPCAGCGGRKPIYTDGEDFYKWDEYGRVYRIVDFRGEFYPLTTHPAFCEQQLMLEFGSVDGMSSKLKLATEHDIMWRTLRLIVDSMSAHRML
jgi:hypothetical protein